MLENNPASFYFQPQNTVQVRPWTGDMTDAELFSIIPILEKLKDVEDVRLSLGDHTTRFIVKTQLPLDESMYLDQSPIDTDGPDGNIDSCSDLNNKTPN